MISKEDFLKKIKIKLNIQPQKDFAEENALNTLKWKKNIFEKITRARYKFYPKKLFVEKIENISISLFEKSLYEQAKFNEALIFKLDILEKKIKKLEDEISNNISHKQ